MSALTEPFNMTEMLRREYVQGAVKSVKYLESFSDDETYQSHVYRLVSLLKLTEMALSIEASAVYEIEKIISRTDRVCFTGFGIWVFGNITSVSDGWLTIRTDDGRLIKAVEEQVVVLYGRYDEYG